MDVERERRQLRLMLERLAVFEAGQWSLAALAADLEGLLHALAYAPDDWRQTFLRHWGKLHDELAVRVERRDPSVTDAANLFHAAAELRHLIQRRMDAS